MAAIDKIYLNNWEQYLQFKKWCEEQPPLKDKYGVSCKLTDYLCKYNYPFETDRPVFNAPYYLDAYVIRNCPFDFIQEELMLNYGYWSQKRLKEYYNEVKNWSEESECPFWAKLEDFIFNEDGTITLKGLEKSDYELIKEGNLYNTTTSNYYEVGKHFRCIKKPHIKYNTPFGIKNWWISVNPPEGIMWYHKEHNSWDFSSEFVISKWSSSSAHVHTIRSLERLLIKWKLPVGTKVRVTGRYVEETYEFIIKK